MTMLRLLKRVAFIGTLLGATFVFPQRSLASEDEPMQQPYFYLTEKSNERCFMVTVGRPLKGEPILGPSTFHVHYELRDKERDPEEATVSLQLYPLSDTNGRIMPSMVGKPQKIEPGKGSRGFGTNKAGKYSLCAVFSSETKDRELQLFLDFEVGPRDEKFEKIKKNMDLNDMQISLVRLRRTAEHMLTKADYLKDVEMQYHVGLVSLNREVAEWPVVQVLILLGTGFYQVRHLKQFFKAKRLV